MIESIWRKYLTQPGHIRVVALEGTALARELCTQQGLEGQACVGFAEAIVGALLIASSHKSNEAINLNAKGSGLYKQAVIDASPDGLVRGFLRLQTDPELHTYGAEGHNGPWGSGVLSVLYTKNFEGKYPYTGMVPISTGILDEAINEYYRDSEQLVSRLGLDVRLENGAIVHARGVLVQAMGGADEEELARIQTLDVGDVRALAMLASEPAAFVAAAEDKLAPARLAEVEARPLKSFCTCSQERIERALQLTGEEDTLHALADDPVLSVTCDFCRRQYTISAERIKSLFSPDPSRLQ